MENFNLNQVSIDDGFFKGKLELNSSSIINNVYARFKETGRVDALKCIPTPNPTDVYWDSDIAKMIEGAAYILNRVDDKNIKKWYDEIVEDIINNQREDGYFNSNFQVYQPENVFKYRPMHELYCAGHLFEAAVAADKYLNDRRLLSFADKYVDYIYKRFVVDKDTAFTTPGHEEIELALIKLYEHTNNEKYLELCKFFIDNRGLKPEPEIFDGIPEYSQSHLPVREQETAVGHAVRALYLYIAMADLARISNDQKLKNALDKISDDIINKKMYVTGGLGSRHLGERFTEPYDLPNHDAYSETCASIALAFFCDRMFRLTKNPKFCDVLERALYNGILSGVSLDGQSFFYINPLELYLNKIKENDKHKHTHFEDYFPISQRIKVFLCSCCPPNICRFIEQIPQFIYYRENDTIYVNQCVSSTLNEDVFIKMNSDIPYTGKVNITVNSFGKNITLKVRKPRWCDSKFKNVDGEYIVFSGVFNNEIIELDFNIKVKKAYANPLVDADVGKTAITYGPLIFCAESVDNDSPLSSIIIDKVENAKIDLDRQGDFPVKIKLPVKAIVINEKLYSFEKPTLKDATLSLIPYFAWANRGETDMRVWFSCKI